MFLDYLHKIRHYKSLPILILSILTISNSYSSDVKDGTNGVNYIPSSCKSIGNDGNHFNIAIIDPPTNTVVPDSVF